MEWISHGHRFDSTFCKFLTLRMLFHDYLEESPRSKFINWLALRDDPTNFEVFMYTTMGITVIQ